jgi:hypothetical protein
MQFHERESNSSDDFATALNSTGASAATGEHRIGSGIIIRSKKPAGATTRPANNPFGAFRIALGSQKLEDFLEGFFAVLAIVYFVAAASFAGVFIGNTFG